MRKDISEFEKLELEREYQVNKYLDQNEISALAKRLEIEEFRVKMWFKNRRTQKDPADNCDKFKMMNCRNIIIFSRNNLLLCKYIT